MKLVNYPAVFKTLSAKQAASVPHMHDVLKPKKLIKLLAGFVEPTLDNFANMLASDSEAHNATTKSDPFLNYDFFVPGMGAANVSTNL